MLGVCWCPCFWLLGVRRIGKHPHGLAAPCGGGATFLKGLGSELALRAGPAEGQESAEGSLDPAVSRGHLSATTVAVLGAAEQGFSSAWVGPSLGADGGGRDLQGSGCLGDEGTPVLPLRHRLCHQLVYLSLLVPGKDDIEGFVICKGREQRGSEPG